MFWASLVSCCVPEALTPMAFGFVHIHFLYLLDYLFVYVYLCLYTMHILYMLYVDRYIYIYTL